ncbi:Uncharacterised protein [Legionella beliardensis]|uniref:Uncharacterized protein n=1 Tax=Legionella beliardensis TaxID=91822 RepID=A0A378JSK4_9GAMM|nr:hypothetical protein [Legionella beliardensis]STX55568.1 Uncharacterised protein [Legionella beliardensis]
MISKKVVTSPLKWVKEEDFRDRPSQIFINLKNGFKIQRQAVYINSLVKYRQEIYVQAYEGTDELCITFIVNDTKMTRELKKECEALSLDIRIEDGGYTQDIFFNSSDKHILTSFILAIDKVNPLVEIKEEILQIVNFELIFPTPPKLKDITASYVMKNKITFFRELIEAPESILQQYPALDTNPKNIFLLNMRTIVKDFRDLFCKDNDEEGLDFLKKIEIALKDENPCIAVETVIQGITEKHRVFIYGLKTNVIGALAQYNEDNKRLNDIISEDSEVVDQTNSFTRL